MIGYSDSGKDAGRLAAAWGLYVVQARRAACINKSLCLDLCPNPASVVCTSSDEADIDL